MRRLLLGFSAVALVAILAYAGAPRSVGAAPQRPGRPDGGFDGGFGGAGRDLALVKEFDKDGDGVLNAAERKAARASLPQGDRRGGFGFRQRGSVPVKRGPTLTPADVRAFPDAPLYDTATLRTLFLTFEGPEWEDELMAFYHTDVQVPATMIVDGRTYRDVGVAFRGNSSFRRIPQGLKHSISLSVDFRHEDQRLAGYRSLDLLNANEDPTFLRSVLYSEIARDFIPTPKANFMRVVINGESWGIYANQQAFNRDFLRDFYDTTKGARWKVPGSPRGRGGLAYLGESVAPYRRLYEIKTKDDPKAWADLIHLTKVLSETPPRALEAALAPILDVDGALKFLALDVALINNDGYWLRASDYSIYEDPTGRFHVIPHDFNEGLNAIEWGFGGMSGPGARPGTYELDPLIGLDDDVKVLRSKLLAVPALRARYLGYVRDIAERWLDWKKLGPLVTRYQALIASDVKTDTHKIYGFDEFDAASPTDGSIRIFADRRRAYLLAATAAK